MKRRILGAARLFAASLFCVPALSPTHASAALSVKDVVEFVRIVEPPEATKVLGRASGAFSPDGRHFFLVTRKSDIPSNRNLYSLLLFDVGVVAKYAGDASNAAPPAPTTLFTVRSSENFHFFPSIRTVTWSADSKSVTLIADVDDAPSQVYKVDIATRRAKRLTQHPQQVLGFTYDSRSGTVAYVTRLPSRHPEMDKASTIIETNTLNQIAAPTRTEAFPIDYQLFVVNERTPGKYRALGPYGRSTSYFSGFWLSPDAKRVIAIQPMNDLDTMRRWIAEYPLYSLINDTIKSFDPYRQMFPHGLIDQFVVYEVASGKRTAIAAPVGRFIGGLSATARWTSNDRVVLGNTFLPAGVALPGDAGIVPAVAELDLKNGAWNLVRALKPGTGPRAMTEGLQSLDAVSDDVLELDIGSAGKERYERSGAEWKRVKFDAPTPPTLAVTISFHEEINSPLKVMASDPATKVQKLLFDPNPGFRAKVAARAEPYQWTDEAGKPLIGQLIYPEGYEKGKRYPLLLQLYGAGRDEFVVEMGNRMGPGGAVRNLAANGVMVLVVPNMPSPDGYATYRSAIKRALAAMNEQGLIDPSRVGITGFSSMGKFVRDVITFSDIPMAAAMIVDSWNPASYGYLVYNYFQSSYAMEEIEKLIGAPPWGEKLPLWLERDPTLHTGRIRTPLRISHHGAYLPPHWDAFALLRSQGKPVEMIWFPKGAHQLRRPQEKLDALNGITDWFTFWLRGYEDPDPAKAEQYNRWRDMRVRQDKLAANGEEITTEGGVRIRFASRGTGPVAKDGQVVLLHYVGTLQDGTVFDTSRKRGQPLAFTLGRKQVIKGYEEAFRQLRVGDKATLTIPPLMAYGEKGSGKVIPPNATLTFEVEVLKLEDHALADVLGDLVESGGIAAAQARFDELRKTAFAGYYMSESQMNGLGYRLMRREKFSDALSVFDWNVALYPQSGNALDSQAEALAKAGDKSRSDAACRKALELEPTLKGAQGSFCASVLPPR